LKPLLHIAAFWIDGDDGDEIADYLQDRKLAKSRGAVVTFSLDTANDPGFQRVMERLDLAEVNERAWETGDSLRPMPR
jgi:hypothetical protein